jgi:hypothetical protein
VETNLNTFAGQGGTIQGGKLGGGHWRYMGWITWRSPGLELNDQGYLRQADAIQQVAWAQYRIWEPFSIFRRININFNQWSLFDFSGTRTNFGGNMNINTQFKNFFSFGVGLNRDIENINRSELRGGPALKYPGDWNNWIFISSDERKKVVLELFSFNNWGDQGSSRFFNVGCEISYRPLNSLVLSVEPGYTMGKREMQYVETIELENDNRYIISTLNSDQFSADFRINFNITPDLTIQYWGQPFLFSGNYSNFKKVTNPMAEIYQDRFHTFTENEIFYDNHDEIFKVDDSGNGEADYSFDNPNFNFFEFRSNMVLRWEYIPGSTVYLVWSQGRTGDNNFGQFNFRQDMDKLFNMVPHNIILLKFSYRISV